MKKKGNDNWCPKWWQILVIFAGFTTIIAFVILHQDLRLI
jgi:hypothetical protein